MKNNWLVRGIVLGLALAVLLFVALFLQGMVAVLLGPTMLGLTKVIADLLATTILLVTLSVIIAYLERNDRVRRRKSNTVSESASGAGAQEPS